MVRLVEYSIVELDYGLAQLVKDVSNLKILIVQSKVHKTSSIDLSRESNKMWKISETLFILCAISILKIFFKKMW